MQWMGTDLTHWLIAIILALLVIRDALGRSYTKRVVKENNEARQYIRDKLKDIWEEVRTEKKGDE